MTAGKGTIVSKGLLKAATSGVNLWMFGLTATTSAVLGWWPVAGAACLAYAAAIGLDLTRPQFWTRVVEEVRRTPPPLPCESDLRTDASRRLLARLEAARSERVRALEQLPEPIASRRVPDILEAAALTEEAAIGLLQTIDELTRYLEGEHLGRARRDAYRIEALTENATDPALRSEHIRARAAVEARMEALLEVDRSAELIAARLETLVSALETVPYRLVQLKVMVDRAEIDGAGTEVDEVVSELSRALVGSADVAGAPA